MDDAEKAKPEDETKTDELIDDGEPDTDTEEELDDTEETETGDTDDLADGGEKQPETSDAKTVPVEEAPVAGAPAPSGIDWSTVGPRAWTALHNILSGNKTKHDDKYIIEASHDDVSEAHDVLKQ